MQVRVEWSQLLLWGQGWSGLVLTSNPETHICSLPRYVSLCKCWKVGATVCELVRGCTGPLVLGKRADSYGANFLSSGRSKDQSGGLEELK